MAKISAIFAREILDSRGYPTIETTIWADNNKIGVVASIPSGASTGKHEAVELRDQDPNRFDGKGVIKAVANVNQAISKYLIGKDPTKQNDIDQLLLDLDGTNNKSRLGANTILSISQAVCELGAKASSLSTYAYLSTKYGLHKPTAQNLPTPFFNVINGGKHGVGNLDFQEFHLVPSSRFDFKTSLQIGSEIYHQIRDVLKEKKANFGLGDEGGYTPNLHSNKDALEILTQAISTTPYQIGKDVFLGLDLAASVFHQNGEYHIRDRKESFSSRDFINFLIDLKKRYHLFALEDPLEEDSWDEWSNLTSQMGQDTLIIGDDLLVTNKTRLEQAIKKRACNTVLIKPNQIGTISETVSFIKLAKENKMASVVSHRSGDTNENFLADFAVGIGADFVKFGAPSRGERVIKYNRLSSIQDYLTQPNLKNE